jgi:hypothetical protein
MLCIRHPPGWGIRAEQFFFTLLLTFPAFGVAASCEEIGELVVSAKTLKKIAAIETAKNFIVGS